MSDPAGWCYVLTHPAWNRIGVVKIGMTGRDPAKRAAEITTVSGLVVPCRVVWCMWVSDRVAVENTIKRNLDSMRVTKRRELFRTDVATARQAIEAAACAKAVVPVVRRRAIRSRRRLRSRGPVWRAVSAGIAVVAVYFWIFLG